MPPKFFITHSWKDKDIDFARKLCDDLRRNGLDGFFDAYAIQPGDDIARRIAKGLEECDVYVPLLSSDAIESPWCVREISIAINLSMERERKGRPRIVPVIISPCKLPTILQGILYINFDGRYDDALRELLTKGFGLPSKLSLTVTALPSTLPTVAQKLSFPNWLVPAGIVMAVVVACIFVDTIVNGIMNNRPTGTPVYVAAGEPTNTLILMPKPTDITRSIETSTPRPTDTQRPTTTFIPQPTDTPIPTVNPTLGIGSTKISPIDGATMVYVPAGEFLMGSSDTDKNAAADEMPQHTVYLDAFWIDKYEVTNALYKKCVDAGQCAVSSSWVNGTIPPGKENHPVTGVYWSDAVAYARWAGERLPTEAEWEKAACWDEAKQVKLIYPWGNAFDSDSLNSYEGNKGDTALVGSYPSGVSPNGALDMAGNVWEWVADWYDQDYYSNSPKNNPKGPDSGATHVLRGGSWLTNLFNVRCAFRSRGTPVSRNYYLGFRVAESVSP